MSKHCSKYLHEHLHKAVNNQLTADEKRTCQMGGSSRESVEISQSPAGPSVEVVDNVVDAKPERVEAGIRAALIESFLNIDNELFNKGSANETGTTAVVALLGKNHLWVANCGEQLIGKQLGRIHINIVACMSQHNI